ncbi:hypothetical protein WMF11_47230 [Sorangium sp. So ce295]|uniref:hypothetical protein n=1 Tax=Sorangium sp. So ce295 TaxID=3133295 RepID=UPI003F63B147
MRVGVAATILVSSSFLAACSDGGSSAGDGGTGGTPGSGGAAGTGAAGATGTGGAAGVGGVGGAGPGEPIDLCAGLVQDKEARPMTELARPALGEAVTDAEFGTSIRRITAVAQGGGNDPVIKPMYSTISAWNADESRLLLFSVAAGEHQLYDGKTYQFIEALDISPADIEQVYWHTSDPDVLFYVDGKDFIRYHVGAGTKEVVTTFDFCSGGASAGSDPLFMSWDSNRIGLTCDDQVFIYDVGQNTVLARKALGENPAQVAPSGTLAFLSDSGGVTDPQLNVVRTLDLLEPYGHASLSRVNGHDTWNGAVYDPGPGGNDDIGLLVTWDLAEGTSKVVIGPETGWPYPPTGHISGMAYKQPGWVFVSSIGDASGRGVLDMENLIADTSTGKVCRIGRHRSWGKENTHLAEPYWAEPHTVPSPSGTRAVFGSDWGNGDTVDAYVIELPSYTP